MRLLFMKCTTEKLQMIQILSHAAGSHGMIGGQAIDLDMTGKSIDEATLYEMHHGKTSALFIAALKFGAIIANGSTSTFHDLGSDLGLAFQFLDDLLDATSNQETLGKKIGGDKEKGKQTAISLYGIEGTIQKLKTLKGKIEHKTIQFPA
ncbi:MAG: hypothetical protein FJZ64_02290, partial [Chlamydiae bacterium]|nr:hypothetical protein [Chlamydiota bacterium]